MDFAELISNRFVLAGLVVVAFAILSKVLVYIIDKIILALTRHTKTSFDDEIVSTIKNPLTWLILSFGLAFALKTLQSGHYLIDYSSKLVITVQILLVVVMAVRVADILINHWGGTFSKRTKSTIDRDVLPIARKSVKAVLVILALLLIMSSWDINIGGFLAGMGIAGIAIGFAVKDSLANIFGGISLILDEAYKVGDIIQLESGEIGNVVDIGLRSTKIRTRKNELMILPNGYMANSKILNHQLPDLSVRVDVNFCVEYGTEIDLVEKVISTTLKKNDYSLDEPEPTVLFLLMGDFSLNFQARFWIQDVRNRVRFQSQATKDIYNALKQAKIGIPFPTNLIHLKTESSLPK